MDLTTRIPTTVKPKTVVPKTRIPMTELPKTILPTIDELKTTVPKTKVPLVSNTPLYEREYNNRTNQEVSPFSNYNDTETINSLADIVYNSLVGNDKRTDNKTFPFLNNSVIRDIPVLNLVGTGLDLIDHVYRNTIIPIQQGNPTASLINALQDLGETMDILANPIKGAIIETYHNGPSGFITGLYKGSIGRVNYDYNTGNVISDIALEVISDPFNWISFGAASGLKTLGTASTDALQEAAEITIKKGGKVFVNESILNLSEETGQKQLKSFLKNISKDTIDDFAKKGIDITTSLKQYGAGIFTEEFMQNAVEIQLRNLNKLDSTSFFIKKGLIGIARTTEKIESYLFRAAAWTSFIPTPYLLKQLSKATPIANTLDVLSDHIYKTTQIITGVEDPLDVKYIENTLAHKQDIQDAFNEFQDFIKIEDRISLIDIEEAFRSVASDKLLNLKTILKESEDLTNRNNLYQILLAIMSADEGKQLKNVLTDEATLIKTLNDLNYKGTTIYTCIKSVFNNNIRLISKINKQYDGAFSDVYKNYIKHKKQLFVLLNEAQMKEQSKELLKQITDKNPGIQKYLADESAHYYKNQTKYSIIIETYPDFIYQLKAQQKDLYLKLADFKTQTIVDGSELPILKANKNNLLKNIQQHQDYILKYITTHKLDIDKKIIKEYGHLLKQIVSEGNSNALHKVIDLLMYTEKYFTDAYKEAVHYRTMTEFSNSTLNKELDILVKEIPEYRSAKTAIEKAKNSIANSLKNIDKQIANSLDSETIASNYITFFKETVKPTLESNKAFSHFNTFDLLGIHLLEVQTIYNTDDLEKIIPKLKIKMHKLINDLTFLSTHVDTFIDKTIPDLINHFSEFNSLTETQKRLANLTDRKISLNERALDKALKTPRTNTKIFSDFSELSGKELTMLGDGNKIASVTDLTKENLDIVSENDVNTFLEYLFNNSNNTSINIANDINTIELLIPEVIIKGNSEALERVLNNINNLREYYNALQKNTAITQHEKLDIISNIELLKNDLHMVQAMVNVQKTNVVAKQLNKAIANCLDYINMFRADESRNKLVYLAAGDNLYITSINKAVTLKEVYQDSTGIKALVHAFNDVDGVHYKTFRTIKKLAEDSEDEVLAQAYSTLTDFFDRYQAVESFITDLYLDRTFGDTIADRLFDSVTKYDKVSISEFINHLDYHVNKIFENADIGLQAGDRSKALSINALVKNMWLDISKGKFKNRYTKYIWDSFTEEERMFFKTIGESGEKHNALDDIKITELYLRLVDKDNYFHSRLYDSDSETYTLINKNGGKAHLMDIETTGIETHSSLITEFAMKVAGNDSHTINLRLKLDDYWYPPAPGVITTKFPDIDEKIAEQKYMDFYNPNINKDADVVWVNLEEMADLIVKHFNSSAVGVNDTIIGHNIKPFDLRVVQNFLDFVNEKYSTSYYLPTNPTNYTFIDSYQDMLNKEVPSLFTTKMKQAFKQHLSDMLSVLNPDTNSAELFKPVSISESKAIIELDNLLKNSNNSSNIHGFTEIQNSLSELKGKVNDFIKLHTGAEYKESQLIFTKSITQTEEGITIYKNNLKLAKEQIEKELTESRLPREQFKEQTRKLKVINNLLKAADNTDIPYVNIQMLMDSYKVSNSVISYIGAANTNIINNFFNYKDFITQFENGKVPVTILTKLNKITKNMNATVANLRKITSIYDNRNIIEQALNILYNDAIKQNPLYLKYLRVTNQDPRYMFAELKYLYELNADNKVKLNHLLESSLGTEQTKTVLNLLENSYKILQGDWKDYNFIDDKIDLFMKRTLDGPDIAVRNHINRTQLWKDFVDTNLKKFTAVANAPGIVTTRTDMIASQAEPMELFLDLFKNRLNKADKAIQRAYIQSLLDCSDYINISKIEQLIDLAPEDLLNILCFQSMFIGFDTPFVNKYNQNIMKKLLTKKDEWLKYGIEFDYNKVTGEVFIFPNQSVKFNCYLDDSTNTVKYVLNEKEVELFKLDDLNFGSLFEQALKNNKLEDKELVNQFFKSQQAINNVSNFEATGTTYEMVTKKFFESLPKQLPTNVLNKITRSDFINDYLFKDRPRFNMTYLGSNTFRRKFSSSAKSDIVAAMMNTFSSTVKNATERFHYIEYTLNSGYDFNLLAEKCKNLGELQETLKNYPNFVLGVCVKNDKGIEVLKRLKLNTELDFERAKKFGAKIYDEHIFSKLESIINAKSWDDSNKFLNFYTKAIQIYKQGYLFSTGFVVRNAIDTFMRNLTLSQGNIPETAKQTYRAMKLYQAYNDTVKILTDLVTERSGVLNRKTINDFFKYQPDKFPLSKEEFDFAHSLLNEGAFMGEVRAWKDYKAFMKEVKDSNFAFENTKEYAEAYDLYVSQQNYKRWFGTFNEDIENIQRLAGYLTLQDNGIPFTKAIYDLKASHFDYSSKTDLERMLELVIPFYSFKVKNLHYWLDSLEKYGWLSNVMRDFMTPIWNFDEYDQYELERNRSLQYNIKTGNIVFDNGLTFKLNPSMMDAMQLVTDPIGSIGSSMFVGIQLLTDAAGNIALQNAGTKSKEFMQTYLNVNAYNEMQPKEVLQYALNLVPYGAAVTRFMNGLQYAQDINNPLPTAVPSLFGRVKRFEPYTPKQYNKKQYSKSYSKYRKIAKPRKTYPRKNYQPYRKDSDYYPINFKNIYIDGMYSVPNISTYTAQANRYYHFSRLPKIPRSNIYNKLYNTRGKPRWDAMLQPVSPQNLKYVIKNTIHYK